MAVPSLSTVELLLVTLFTIILVKFLAIFYRRHTYWKKNGVPYAKTSSIFGATWTVFLHRTSFPAYCKSIYDYNPNVRYIGIMDFDTPTVVIRDPELIKEIGVKNFEHFPDHRSFVTEEIDPTFGKNLFSLKGDRWREMRNTLSPSFTASKMRFMFDLVSKCSQDFVNYLHDHPEHCTMLELKDAFTRYANDVIATVAFGISVNSMKDPENEFYKRGIDVSKFGGTFRLLKFILFGISSRLTRALGLTFLSRATSKFFWDVVSETVKARDAQGIVRPDMIHLLMQARDPRRLSSDKMTIDDIVAQVFIFFLAGFDTVSTLMSYAAFELAVHQDIQEKLREEVDRYLKEGNGRISYESLSKMEYLEMVISETLRMHPPVLLIDRLCAKKYELPPSAPGYKNATVYPGENVWFPSFALHHDPKHFPDPERFHPERFREENRGKIHPYAYIPFGVGPRMCIGNRFALLETKILIVRLLEKFVLKPCQKTRVPIVYEKGNFTLVPENGLWIALEKRNA